MVRIYFGAKPPYNQSDFCFQAISNYTLMVYSIYNLSIANLIINVLYLDELSVMRESVAEALSEIVLTICSQINRQQYMPKMPTR